MFRTTSVPLAAPPRLHRRARNEKCCPTAVPSHCCGIDSQQPPVNCKREEPRHGVQQRLWILVAEVCPGQEVGADRLQTVSSRLIRAQHQGCRLDRLLDDGNLALVDVNQFPRPFPSPSVPSPLPPEVLLRQCASFVHPGCTIAVLAVLGEDVKSGLRQAPFAAGPETV
jgi:hypothetical protein